MTGRGFFVGLHHRDQALPAQAESRRALAPPPLTMNPQRVVPRISPGGLSKTTGLSPSHYSMIALAPAWPRRSSSGEGRRSASGSAIEEAVAILRELAPLSESAVTEDEPFWVILFSEITPTHVRWTWAGRVPRGMLTVVVGSPDRGKTLLPWRSPRCYHADISPAGFTALRGRC